MVDDESLAYSNRISNARRRNGLYVSPYAGFTGKRPSGLIRGCPDDDLDIGLPDLIAPGLR